ncbi:MAG: hypothetical protein RLY27_2331 [Pseudomonadota bacterium]
MTLSPFKNIKSLAYLVTGSIAWLFIWIFFAETTSTVYSYHFSRSSEVASLYQCININAFRSFLYLILFYGQLLIIKTTHEKINLRNFFKLYICIQELRLLTEMTFRKLLKISKKVIVWIFYWTILSWLIFWFTSSHFLGDCDNGDLDCTCNNFKLLFPVFIITLIAGFIYIACKNMIRLNAKKL